RCLRSCRPGPACGSGCGSGEREPRKVVDHPPVGAVVGDGPPGRGDPCRPLRSPAACRQSPGVRAATVRPARDPTEIPGIIRSPCVRHATRRPTIPTSLDAPDTTRSAHRAWIWGHRGGGRWGDHEDRPYPAAGRPQGSPRTPDYRVRTTINWNGSLGGVPPVVLVTVAKFPAATPKRA